MFKCNLGKTAQETGKVIAQAIVSAIYTCRECKYSEVAEFM